MNEKPHVIDSFGSPSNVAGQRLTPCYLGESKAEKGTVLMKRTAVLPGGGLSPVVLKEMYYLKMLSSPYTPRVLDVVLTPTHTYLVQSFLGPSLLQLLTSSPGFPQPQAALSLAFSLLERLEWIHRKSVAHLALDPGCVLVEKDGGVGLEGFSNAIMGIAADRARSNHFHFNTYSAPELLTPTVPLTSSSDMWSFALILLVLLTRHPLPHISSKSVLDAYISQYFPEGAIQCSEEKLSEILPISATCAIDLLQKLLILDPSQRLTATEAKSHPLFAHLTEVEE